MPTTAGPKAAAGQDTSVEHNLGLVHACAHRFKGRGIEYDDLYQAGCMGLVKASAAFDADRGVMFSTYAVPVILGEIRRLFRDGGTVKVSRSLKELGLAAGRTRELLGKVAEMLSVLPPVTVYEPEYVPKPPVIDTSAPLDIQRADDGTWLVEGPWLQRLMGNVNFKDYESRMWFDKSLRESGLYQQLEEMGIQDGDTVSMYDFEFEYQR